MTAKGLALVLLLVAGLAAAEMTLTLVDDAAKTGAVCLDGTVPGYYFRKATNDEHNRSWVIHIQGGGWCYSLIDCAGRANTALGSSSLMAKTLSDGGPLLESAQDNPLYYDWNHVEIAYCDGASFSGNRDDPVTVGGQTLYFRGFRVLRAVIGDLMERQGLKDAKEVFLSGCSAGGLSTYLHADQIRALLPSTVATFKAAPFSGLFLHEPNVEGVSVYESQLHNVFDMQNCSGGVPQACVAAQKPGEEWKCIFAQEAHPYIETPFFLMNSAYDGWSARCIFGAEPVNPGSAQNGNCTAVPGWADCLSGKGCTAEQIGILNKQWGDVVRKVVATSKGSQKLGNGAFIYSCYLHCAESYSNLWDHIRSGDGTLMRDAVQKWWLSNNERAELHTYGDCVYTKDFCCNPTCCA